MAFLVLEYVELTAFESWEGLRQPAKYRMVVRAELELEASDTQVLPVPAFP